MWNLISRAAKRLDRDQRGNVAVLFAFSMVPMIGLLGGAVDVARQHRYKTEILNAMDATVLAVARKAPASDAAALDPVSRNGEVFWASTPAREPAS